MAPEYIAYAAETGTLDTLVGMLTDQTPATVTYANLNGTQSVWPRATIQTLQPQPWSIMPEGLEAGLNAQGLADLLEFIMTTPR